MRKPYSNYLNQMATTEEVKSFLKPEAELTEKEKYFEQHITHITEGLKANAYYFNNFEWANEYLTYCHRSQSFKDRWTKALGDDWSDKIVVDIGCGPGNIFATLGKQPRLLLGVDVAPTALEIAFGIGYKTILADANSLPFVSGFADIVTLNATLHHCENMEAVLAEAARLVKPGGLLVTDHDPQLSAWDFKGLAKLLWNARLWYYKFIQYGFHKDTHQQHSALASEIHHKPGHGVTKEMFKRILEPMGFEVNVFSHNHDVGAEVLHGEKGRAALKYRLGNLLSGRNPDDEKSALSLMCVAKRF